MVPYQSPPTQNLNIYSALRDRPKAAPFKKGDMLALFGELFSRGYANGLVDEAQACGLEVVYATVGRREKDGTLRALNSEELQQAPKNLINLPLEAGFDLEVLEQGVSLVDLLKDVRLNGWEEVQLSKNLIEEARGKARLRFVHQVQEYLKALEKKWKPGQNVVVAHLMAGGVPRTKIVMPVMNRVFKGTGERFIPSERFWKSDLGYFCQENFYEVSAETFRILLEQAKPFKARVESSGAQMSFLAYGYHGTEVFLGGEYRWQTYTPYLQGWAKKRLEDYSREFHRQGYSCCVYNCPEILTNSSSIFQGVEVCLYPLLGALKRENPRASSVQELWTKCQGFLKEGKTPQDVFDVLETYAKEPRVQEFWQFPLWPQHSERDQLERMLRCSEELIQLHRDEKQLLTFPLSEIVFTSCGRAMLHDGFTSSQPVQWLNHDLVASLFL